MLNKTKTVIFTILAIIISFLLVYFYDDTTSYYGAQQAYRVYLNGNAIALIKNKNKLENYIDKEQEDLKDKYNVSKIYIPEGLEIKQELTYDEKIEKPEEVYEEIKDQEPFTIEGYVIKINKKVNETDAETEENKVEDKELTIYVLDKQVFKDAIAATVLSFIDAEKYKTYLDETQKEIGDLEEGETIENVYLKETIKIKKDHIPVDEEIFTDSKMLAKYLLYGTTENQLTYIVKTGDTIPEIANNNKLNVTEFLIANKGIDSKDTLLYEGQTVVVDAVNPIITVIEDTKEAVYQQKDYKTEIQEDDSFYVGYSQVIQSGEKGEELVTRNVRKENGAVTNVINISTIETKAPVNRIVKTGSRTAFVVGNTGIWAWPTQSGYMITTYYGHDNSLGYYRWHAAIDISGMGCNSPIYAANDGTVITATWQNSLGYYVEINHNNGYITLYAHLNAMYVSAGQGVEMGQVIGAMGSTGYSTGCHLHYQARYNNASFDPFELYR